MCVSVRREWTYPNGIHTNRFTKTTHIFIHCDIVLFGWWPQYQNIYDVIISDNDRNERFFLFFELGAKMSLRMLLVRYANIWLKQIASQMTLWPNANLIMKSELRTENRQYWRWTQINMQFGVIKGVDDTIRVFENDSIRVFQWNNWWSIKT